jgi:hypothetical protein
MHPTIGIVGSVEIENSPFADRIDHGLKGLG